MRPLYSIALNSQNWHRWAKGLAAPGMGSNVAQKFRGVKHLELAPIEESAIGYVGLK